MTEKINISQSDAGESQFMRDARIQGTDNGRSLRTRVVRDKTKYTRKQKHKSDFHN